MATFIYNGIELTTRPRQIDRRVVIDLDLRDTASGLVFQRWWPVPVPPSSRGFESADAAEAYALQFAREFIDRT